MAQAPEKTNHVVRGGGDPGPGRFGHEPATPRRASRVRLPPPASVRTRMQRAFPLFGLLGLVGCFLPLLPGFTLFDARELDAWRVYLIVIAFAVPLALGFADKLTAASSLAATACFGYVLYTFGFDTFDLAWHGSIGGKAMAIAAVAGFSTSLGALAATGRS
jgi:hypothetical protein